MAPLTRWTTKYRVPYSDLLKYAVNKSGCVLKTNISQGNVGTCFKGGGIFNGPFTANLLPILAMQKF